MPRNYREKPLTEEEVYAIMNENSDAEFLSSDEDDEICDADRDNEGNYAK